MLQVEIVKTVAFVTLLPQEFIDRNRNFNTQILLGNPPPNAPKKDKDLGPEAVEMSEKGETTPGQSL